MNDDVMEGQLSVFDILAEKAEKKPCEYRFQRSIGQLVMVNGMEGKIVKIEPYYTEIMTDEGMVVGTPSTTVPVRKSPSCFADYIGRCEFCFWYKYGLHRTEKDKYVCEWAKNSIPAYECHDKGKWTPDVRKIPRLCGNCAWSNCFHYQEDTKAGGGRMRNGTPLKYPVEEPNIYCTREDGSVNRSRPYEAQSESTQQLNTWDFVHEFDTCDAWQSDGTTLDGRPNREK